MPSPTPEEIALDTGEGESNAMPSLNRVILMGNLTRKPELRYTPNGTAVADLGLAVNRSYTVNGEKREDVLFVDIVAWGKTAENCNEYLEKGSGVAIEGRLQSRSWETKDGNKRTKIEVVADSVQFLSGGKGGAGRPRRESADEARAASQADAEDDVPF